MNERRIVIGYDGSEPSKVALRYAMREGRARHLPVLVAHVAFADIGSVAGARVQAEYSHDALMDAERTMLATAVREAKAEVGEVTVESTIVTGLPADALLELTADAEMIVVGNRGLGTFTSLLVGSTSLQLAAHAPCPVVVAREADVKPGPEAGRVVVGVDGSSGSAAALGYAFEEASRSSRGLTAVYGWEPPAFEAFGWMTSPTPRGMLEFYEAEARRLLAESLAGWTEKYPDVDVRRECVYGHVVSTLVAASKGAALVVVGSRGAGGFARLLLGSVGQGILEHGQSNVAVVPHI